MMESCADWTLNLFVKKLEDGNYTLTFEDTRRLLFIRDVNGQLVGTAKEPPLLSWTIRIIEFCILLMVTNLSCIRLLQSLPTPISRTKKNSHGYPAHKFPDYSTATLSESPSRPCTISLNPIPDQCLVRSRPPRVRVWRWQRLANRSRHRHPCSASVPTGMHQHHRHGRVPRHTGFGGRRTSAMMPAKKAPR